MDNMATFEAKKDTCDFAPGMGPGTLNYELWAAMEMCAHMREDVEESGGVIMVKDDEYKFVFLRNANTGTDIAPVLFTADREQYAKKVIPLFKDGWKQYASFHTHPQFPPWPSHIDMNELFQGFTINYIYSTLTNKLMKYQWIDPKVLNMGVIPEEVEI